MHLDKFIIKFGDNKKQSNYTQDNSMAWKWLCFTGSSALEPTAYHPTRYRTCSYNGIF